MFEMSMSLTPTMKLKPEQRLKLEAKLEQKLEQQLIQKMSLNLYLQQEDIVEGLIRWAEENNSWKVFNRKGFKFVYADVPYEQAKPIADTTGFGFAHCHFNPFDALILGCKFARAKGDWTLFVVGDKIPKEFQDYVAIHERGEELSLGDHYFASQLEWALATHDKKSKKYITFVDNEAPGKFVDLTQKVDFPIIPEELREYLEKEKPVNLSVPRARSIYDVRRN